MKALLRDKAIQLRVNSQLSYSAIRKQLKIAKSTLSYWLREYPLSKEKIIELQQKGWSKGEAGRERFRVSMKKKREEREQQVYERMKKKMGLLHSDWFVAAGIMLYWAEGDKKNPHRISIANTDTRMITFFMKWLEICLDIPRTECRIQLHLYENMDIAQELHFWKNTLQLQNFQFYKPQIRQLMPNSFSYPEASRHGTCSLFLPDTQKKTEVMMGIKALNDCYQEAIARV